MVLLDLRHKTNLVRVGSSLWLGNCLIKNYKKNTYKCLKTLTRTVVYGLITTSLETSSGVTLTNVETHRQLFH